MTRHKARPESEQVTMAVLHCDTLWRHARLATMAGAGLGIVEDGLVAAKAGLIVYAGPAAHAPQLSARETTDCGGRWILPGLIDCHTHLVHAGDRTEEFERRQAGASYQDIARSGGGILATVRATRAASEAELIAQSLPRLDALTGEGVTTIEVKSGYGLSLESEAKMLRAARGLERARDIKVTTTFLGAHALAPEFAEEDGYIDEVCARMLPAIAAEGLADAVDGFCEDIAFTPAQIERVFAAAKALGLPVKLHAEQLSDSGGAGLAARYGALSADHLEYVSDRGVAAMAASGTVAVLLPGALYFLREQTKPPVAALRSAGVPIAIATDCNPGSSPLSSLLTAMNMSAVLFGLTIEECLIGVTRNAARALGQLQSIGTLEPGKRCDLSIWEVDHPRALVANLGRNPLWRRVWHGA